MISRPSIAALSFLVPAILVAALAGCVELPNPGSNMPKGGVIPDNGLFAVTSDFSLSGGFAVIDLDDLDSRYFPDPEWAARVVSPDPVAVAFEDHVFVINRYTYDNVSVLDKKMRLVKQYSVADDGCDPSNPHDMAFVSADRAYITRYECKDLWVINPITGEKLSSINLAAMGYGGKDGIPEMSGMLLHGNTLFVAAQLMDRNDWTPERNGQIVMIDAATDTVIGHVDLLAKNPTTDLVYSPDLDLVLAGMVGRHEITGDGGIEAIDPYAGVSAGWLITESALGGSPGDFAVASPDRAYAVITTADFRSLVVAWNPQTGLREPGVIYAAASSFTLWDIEIDAAGRLFICDRNAREPGIVVIDTADNDRLLTPEPINLGFPPFSLAFFPR